MQKNLQTDAYNSFVPICQSLKPTKMAFSRWMDEQIVVHPDNGILFSA
jgi:hypothetical protein